MRLQIHFSVPLHIVHGKKYLLYIYIALKKAVNYFCKDLRPHIFGQRRGATMALSTSTGVCHAFLMLWEM
jgi:hypothetical protein